MSGFADVFFSWNYWVKQSPFKRERGGGWEKETLCKKQKKKKKKKETLWKKKKTKVISSGKDINTP